MTIGGNTMKWHIEASCGNSPKNQMLIDWIQDYIENKNELPFVTEDSTILYQGKTSILNTFEFPKPINEIHLKTAITHGRIGSVLGTAYSDVQSYPFALFFEFSLGKQPKIKHVDSIIEK